MCCRFFPKSLGNRVFCLQEDRLALTRILLIFCVAVFFFSSPAVALLSSDIPLDSWIYPALEKLEGMGLVDSVLLGSRPFTRLEAARQVAEALSRVKHEQPPQVVRNLLRRLQVDLRQDLDELNNPAERSSYFQPLRSLDVAYLYKNGQDSDLVSTQARQFALNYNNAGIEYSEHHNSRVTFETEARLGRHLLLYARPLAEWQENQYGESSDSSLSLLEGRLALGLGPLEFSAGRQSLWWGQSRHGALVLTNNAQPLDMLRLTNPTPVLLPWILRFLGPFRFDLFVSRLEEDRVVPEPYFGGLRVDFKPMPWLELGASRAVMFGGGDRHIAFDDFLTIVGGENLSGEEDTSNSVASVDARVKIPKLWGAEIYAEIGGEDEADFLGSVPFFSQMAYIGGVYLPRIEPSGRVELRLEYLDTTHQRKGQPVWYRHGLYRSGYIYEGRILGHHAGGDSVDYFGEVQAYLPGDFTLRASYDYQKRGESLPVQEKHHQPAVELEWFLSPHWEIRARYAFDRVENFAFREGEKMNFCLAQLGMTAHW